MKPIGLKEKNNITYINDFSINDLVKEYKTPLYIIDEKQLLKNINDYKDSFKSLMFKTNVVYASKALLTKELTHILSEKDLYMDAVSLGDLFVAKSSDFDMKKIVFHGNNKSLAELEYAVINDVGIIVVDNLYELKLLIDVTNRLEKKINIMLRVNPGIDVHTHVYVQTSKLSSKFGESIFDDEIIHTLISTLLTSKYINLIGFHAHIGSSVMEAEAYQLEIEKMVAFQNKINNEYHLSLKHLNIGGGFGITYTKKNKAMPIPKMISKVIGYLEAEISKTNSLISDVYIEPGRSIVGNAGVTIYSISQIKPTYGMKNYLFIDGGMTDNIRPALYEATYEVDVVNKLSENKEHLVDVVGKCCESGDIIRKDALIPSVTDQDLLIVYCTGAYNYSMFSNYNNMLKPALISVGDKVTLWSRREELSDLIRLFK
ncbi:MAG: diaminopimelate decarboxylase [Bacilli bacterium]|nr:diaminopimelate decarboxylase [Bacilli bacterium]